MSARRRLLEYFVEEKSLSKELLRGRRLRFNDDQYLSGGISVFFGFINTAGLVRIE